MAAKAAGVQESLSGFEAPLYAGERSKRTLKRNKWVVETTRKWHSGRAKTRPTETRAGGITANKSCRRAGVGVGCLDLLREQHTRSATARCSLPLDLPAPLGPFNGPQCGATTRAARSCHGRVGSGPELQSKGQGDRAEKRRST